ncbi:hypothetical protein Q8F55_005847 [Vanrija albida]|uniref:BRCT domain-containing protein n=1 Tax=Vanrija albida TaxID=181172 RepID=A0ABR3Q3S5_9TREE
MPPDRQRPPTSSLFRGLVFFIQSRGNPKLWDDINFIQNHGGGATRDPSNRQLTHVVLNVQNDDNSSCSLQEYPVRDTPLPRLRESWGLNDLLLKFTMSSRTRGPVVVVVDRQWLFECVKRQCVLGPREVRPYGGWQVLGRFGGSGAPPRDNGAKDQIAAEWGDYYSRARPPTQGTFGPPSTPTCKFPASMQVIESLNLIPSTSRFTSKILLKPATKHRRHRTGLTNLAPIQSSLMLKHNLMSPGGLAAYTMRAILS